MDVNRKRIYLCLAHMSEAGMEQKYIQEAFDTNWVVPLGPNVNGFEKDLEMFVNERTADNGQRTAEPIPATEIRYVDIDVTLFDMTGISENGGAQKELITKERRQVLEELVPPAFLHDYDKYAQDIYAMRRIHRHRVVDKLVWFMERVLFKIEKRKNLKKDIQTWG